MKHKKTRSYLRFVFCILITFILLVSLITGCTSSIGQTAVNPTQNETTDSGVKQNESESSEFVPVYGMDKVSINKEINFYIAVPKDTPLKKKLEIIADKLSQFKFSGLPISILEVKNENGKKIAVVNLGEIEENKGITDPANIQGDATDTWIFGYFQGSAGGSATVETLVETFLQREYKGEWIDGIEFRYEGKPISMMHVEPLSKTIFR